MPDMRIPTKDPVAWVELVVHLPVITREVIPSLGGNNKIVDRTIRRHRSGRILRLPRILFKNVLSHSIKPVQRNHISRELICRPSAAFLSNRCRIVNWEADATK